MRVARLLVPISLLLFAASAAPALASVQIGQLQALHESGGCNGGNMIVTNTVQSGTTSYASPIAGVITSWGTKTGKLAGEGKLKVLRLLGGAEYRVVGEDGPRQVNKETSPVFTGVRVPVQTGDLIGLAGGSNYDCYYYLPGKSGYHMLAFEGIKDPALETNQKATSGVGEEGLQLIANVEPDTDLDGYGDETQDACLNNGLGHELPCPALPGPPAPPPAPDTKAPQITLSSRAKQDALKAKAVIAIASADEAVTFTATGSVNVPGAGAFSLTPSTVPGAANAKTSIGLGLSKTVRSKIKTALKNGKKVSASIHVTAKDAAGNPSNATQSVTIKKSTPKKHPK